jgi:hypothetical protein
MTTPIFTRHASGHITVEWPEHIQPEWPVSHELLVQMIEQHNRSIDACPKCGTSLHPAIEAS